MCRLSGHYKPRLMTIAAKRLRPHSPCSQPHLHVRVRLQVSSHRVPHRKPTDNDDNNRTFSHLQLKAGRVKGTEREGGEFVEGFIHWKAAVVSVPWALCVLRHIKRHPAVLSGFGLCRVQQVSVSLLFFIFLFFVSFSYFVCFMIYLFSVRSTVLFIVRLPRL